MRKKRMTISGFLLFFIITLSFFPATELKVVSGMNAENDKKIVLQNKVWKQTLPAADSKSKLNALLLKRLKEERIEQKNSTSMEMAKESSKSENSSSDFSETNVQVQGIDEGDVVKTDGSYIYQIVDGKLHIIKATPANKMTLATQIAFDKSFYPNQMFLYKDQLVIIGHSYEESRPKESMQKMIAPLQETTKVFIYNVKDKNKPKKVRELEVEGGIVSSRLMDGKVYLITNKYPEIWLLKDNPELDMRPKYYDSATQTTMQPVDYNKIKYFPDSNETNFTNIATFDLLNPSSKMNLTTYLGSGNNMYMSKNNLYLAVSNYYPSSIRDSQSFKPGTTVYKFSVKGMNVDFHSSGEVPGTILNQFSMDEYKGYFRIATTEGQVWDDSRPSANNLYILDQNLKQVGELEDLARGERIYSARFMNDRIYIVTFRETDPLFVIDGSNPEKPKVLGELKIPGFSNYLHPYDDNHLIGFGHDTKVMPSKGEGNPPIILTNGVKISLFDVSDMANPKEKFTEIIGGRGTHSPLNYDHKALLYDKKKNLFAFPITVYQNMENSQNESRYEFQGAYVYNIDLKKGFTLKKKITHQKPGSYYEEWENNIERILYIGNSLYTLSPQKISSYEFGSYKQQGELSLKK